jgi:hypothetical protein
VIGAITAGLFAAGVTPPSSSYDSIATVNLSSNQATVDFSSISGTYKHLELRFITRNNRGSLLDGLYVRFNSDSGTNYSDHNLQGDGASASAAASTSTSYIIAALVNGTTANANVFSAGVMSILDYSNTSKNKTTRTLGGFDNNGNGYIRLSSGLWRNTAAVTSITIGSTDGSGILANSSFALYGIKG